MEKQKRNTRKKQLVMSVLEASYLALCHEDIEKKLSGEMDRVTIYRILQGFCDEGKVHKIINENGKTYYALCHHCTAGKHRDNHPHFHCIACNTITCIDKPVAVQPLPAGYTAISSSFLISGYCLKCSNILKTVCVSILLFVVQWTGFAQEKTLPDTCVQPLVHELQEVVVADNNSRLQGENVMNVEKLNVKSGTLQGVSMADKLTAVAGIDNLSTGAGIGKPVIRGLSGNRIAVFAQGIRIENQQWGDEHGLGLDENGYEQVEIIKGPASLLYGSDALGGVLYFTDERYAENNSTESTVHSEFNSNTLGFVNTGTFKLSKNRLHWNLFGGYTTHTDYKDGNNNPVPNSRFNTGNLKTTLGYTSDKFITSLKYSFLKEQYGLTEHLHEEENHEEDEEPYKNGRKPAMPYQNLSTHIISSENIFFFDNGSKLKIDAGYIFNNRKEFEDEHDHAEAHPEEEHAHEEAATNLNLHTFSYNAKWYSSSWKDRWTLTTGSQGMFQNNTSRGEEILIPNASTLDFGAFALTEFHYTQKAYWQFGLRFDTRHITNEAFDNQYYSFNFSTGIYQPVMKNLSLRIQLSSGFRAPNMYELLCDGVHHGTNRYETGNRDLKTENSYQIDVSLDYRTKHLEIFVNPYFNFIRDYIYLQPTADRQDDFPVFSYTQTDARLYGGEAGFHFHPHPWDWLHISGSYSATFGQDAGQEWIALMPSQKIKTTVGASFLFKKALRKFSVYVQNRYSFSQNLVANEETATPSYNLLNTGIVFDFKIKRQEFGLNLSVNNLLNEVYYDHLSRYKTNGIYNMGRSVNVKISLPFPSCTTR